MLQFLLMSLWIHCYSSLHTYCNATRTALIIHFDSFFHSYRLEDLVAHDDIISILTNLIDNDQLPHLLLYGPPGTGTNTTKENHKFCKWFKYHTNTHCFCASF